MENHTRLRCEEKEVRTCIGEKGPIELAGENRWSEYTPKVSIGIPVFNGEKHLEEALDSILRQSYRDFELIISDNASIDLTPKICQAYTAKDPRIRYYRSTRNLGASRNFNQVFKLSSGKYFKWASHDDVLAPEFLSRCVGVLENNPSIVLCYPQIMYIDKEGKRIGRFEGGRRGESDKPHERFRNQLSLFHPCWPIFGVIRASSLKNTSLIGDYIGADRNLLAELSLKGRIHEIPEYLFFGRVHRQSYTYRFSSKKQPFPDYQKRQGWWKEDRHGTKTVFPHWKNFIEYCKSIRRSQLKWLEKLLCYIELERWFIREGVWVIGYNIYIAFRQKFKPIQRFDRSIQILKNNLKKKLLRVT